MEVDEFKSILSNIDAEEFVFRYLLVDGAAHVSNEKISLIRQVIKETYRVENEDFDLWIVGSAKLGFSTTEKIITREGRSFVFNKYRPFSIRSDIDVAVSSKKIYENIWHDISKFMHGKPRFPWRSQKTGDYMMYGWIRFDQLETMPRKNEWFDCFSRLSRNSIFERRRVNGGLFYSKEMTMQYYCRSIEECKREMV